MNPVYGGPEITVFLNVVLLVHRDQLLLGTASRAATGRLAVDYGFGSTGGAGDAGVPFFQGLIPVPGGAILLSARGSF